MALLLVKCPSTGCLRTDISKPGPGECMVLWVGGRGYPIAEMDAKLRDRDSVPQPGGPGLGPGGHSHVKFESCIQGFPHRI